MYIRRDLNTHTSAKDLAFGSDPTVQVGKLVTQYEVKRYIDTRNLSEKACYLVSCSQRVILASGHPYSVKPGNIVSYDNYPAVFSAGVAFDAADGLGQVSLIDYFPRTLNASVETNHSAGQTSSDGSSRSHTSGSSQAQTNTYGASASIGFMGPIPVGNFGVEASHSSTSETNRSDSNSRSFEHGNQVSNSSAMSIKDWGSYADIDSANAKPSWVWGQEFPWNVIQLNDTDANGNVVLPDYVQSLLHDGTQLLPPSELSLFGVDVLMTATWLVPATPGSAVDQGVTLSHDFDYTVASHRMTPAGSAGQQALVAQLNNYGSLSFKSDALDLPLLGLDPLAQSPAVIGFLPRHFDIDPVKGAAFAITSDTNDLLVRGTGFGDMMTADFSAGDATLTVFFKSTEPSSRVVLSMKHWVTGLDGCLMKLNVNGLDLPPRFVSLPEQETGEDNITTVTLRHKDFTSVDYCDFLQYGLNTVTITLSPTKPGQAGTYRLLAMSVA